MRNIRCVVPGILMVLAFWDLSAQEVGLVHGCAVKFRAASASYVLGEPVILFCKAENHTGAKVEIDFGHGCLDAFDFELAGPNAMAVVRNPHLKGGLARSGKVDLQEGDAVDQPIVLDEFITLKQPGTYTLICKYRMGEESIGQPLTLTIAPEDSDKLRSVIAGMVAIALDNKKKDMEEYVVLKRALAYVHSSAAIPELLKAAQLGLEDAVEAFRRIGGPEAAQALTELTKSEIEDVAAKAKSQLAMMKMAENGIAGIPK